MRPVQGEEKPRRRSEGVGEPDGRASWAIRPAGKRKKESGRGWWPGRGRCRGGGNWAEGGRVPPVAGGATWTMRLGGESGSYTQGTHGGGLIRGRKRGWWSVNC